MGTYLITYDLDKPGQNYERLWNAIKKAFPTWFHALESVWIVESALKAEQIRDHLRAFIDSNDKLLVARMTTDTAWYGLGETDWMRSRSYATVY